MKFEKKINIQIRVMGVAIAILTIICGYEMIALLR